MEGKSASRSKLRAVQARLRIALWALVGSVPIVTLLVVASEWNGIPGQPLRDTVAYYSAAEAARSDGDIYDPLPPTGPHVFDGKHYYLYPPPLAALLSFLPRTSLTTFDRLWLVLNLIAFWVLAASLGRIARGGWTISGTLLWGAAAFALPGSWLSMHFGNIDIMIAALVALGLAWPRFAGAGLGFASIFKVSAIWALLIRLFRRPREILPSAVPAAAVCLAASVAVFGLSETVDLSQRWVRDVMPAVSQGQFWGGSLAAMHAGLRPIDYAGNLSISFAPVQLAVLSGWSYEGGHLPGYVRLYLTAFAVLTPLLAGWFTRRRSVTLQSAVVFVVTLFAAPIVRPYVLPTLLLVAAAVLHETRLKTVTDAV